MVTSGTNSVLETISDFHKFYNYKYSFNLEKFVFDLLPRKYRKLQSMAWNVIINYPIFTLYNTFKKYRKEILYSQNVTSQTIVLERFLQLYYENDNIEIVNFQSAYDLTYLYNQDETPPQSQNIINLFNPDETNTFYQVYLFNPVELISDNDFTLYIPTAILNQKTEKGIRILVDSYLSLGVQYNIIAI